MDDIDFEKSRLRSEYRQLRKEMSSEIKLHYDEQIFRQFINSTLYKNTKTILCFVSSGIEVDTIKLINRAFADNKSVAVPKCLDSNGLMEFHIIHSFDDLEQSAFSLLEPDLLKCEKLMDTNNSICVVPGLVFDKKGYRIGFGKGFYDRFLSKYSGIKAGICYNNFIVNKLPHGQFDIAVEYIITQHDILRCNTN